MLVYKKLMDSQVSYLPTLSGNSFCIIGGENAVNGDIASAIGAYGTTTRLAGAHRYETSVMVAKKYFENPENAVLAYAKNYPDGLCGGALAGTVDAPLILTDSKYFSYAAEYAKSIKNGVVLGGTGLISDGAVRTIFGLNADALIPNK
jgi:putative cell wall-binding protein